MSSKINGKYIVDQTALELAEALVVELKKDSLTADEKLAVQNAANVLAQKV